MLQGFSIVGKWVSTQHETYMRSSLSLDSMLFKPRFFKKYPILKGQTRGSHLNHAGPLDRIHDHITCWTPKCLKPQGTKQAFTACCADKVAVSSQNEKKLKGWLQPGGKTTMEPNGEPTQKHVFYLAILSFVTFLGW